MMDEDFEIEVTYVLKETEKAILCLIDGEQVWIPRSQIRDGDIEHMGDSGDLIITAWLAREKGWL